MFYVLFHSLFFFTLLTFINKIDYTYTRFRHLLPPFSPLPGPRRVTHHQTVAATAAADEWSHLKQLNVDVVTRWCVDFTPPSTFFFLLCFYRLTCFFFFISYFSLSSSSGPKHDFIALKLFSIKYFIILIFILITII